MAFELPDLPYANDALEPHIDAETMRIHHDLHHGAYVTNANAALEGTESWTAVESVLTNLDVLPEDKRPQSATTPAATRTTRCSGRSWARTAAASPAARCARRDRGRVRLLRRARTAGQRRAV